MWAQVASKNYQNEGNLKTLEAVHGVDTVQITTQYIDGLGRLFQQVSKQLSPNKRGYCTNY